MNSAEGRITAKAKSAKPPPGAQLSSRQYTRAEQSAAPSWHQPKAAKAGRGLRAKGPAPAAPRAMPVRKAASMVAKAKVLLPSTWLSMRVQSTS